MANKVISETFITAPFILSFPQLLEAKPYLEDGKPKGDPVFSLEGISTKESLEDWIFVDRDSGDFAEGVNVELRAVQLCKKKFGADFDVKAAVKHGGFSWPFKSGDSKAEEKGEKGAHYRGKKFWRAKAPETINGNRNEVHLHVLEDDGTTRKILKNTTEGEKEANNKFYGGAICTAEVNLAVGETPWGKYATFYVNAVIFNADGERLGGEGNVARFYGVKGGQSQTDPTEGMSQELEDEIPL